MIIEIQYLKFLAKLIVKNQKHVSGFGEKKIIILIAKKNGLVEIIFYN